MTNNRDIPPFIFLKVKCQENLKKCTFMLQRKRYKENHSAENRVKNPIHSKVMSNYLMQGPF